MNRCVSKMGKIGYTFTSQVTNVLPLILMRIWDWDQRTEHPCPQHDSITKKSQYKSTVKTRCMYNTVYKTIITSFAKESSGS